MYLILIVLGLIAYFSNWTVTTASGLSLHAFDLAEWSSLHPLVRGGNPALFTTLLLRLPLVGFGVLLSLTASEASPAVRRFHWLGAFAIAIGLLPPLDFVTQLGNANYQQQFILAGITIFALIWGVSGLLKRAHRVGGAAAALIGMIAGVVGAVHALDLMRGFTLDVSVGVGAAFTPLILFATFVAILVVHRLDRRNTPPSLSTPPPEPATPR